MDKIPCQERAEHLGERTHDKAARKKRVAKPVFRRHEAKISRHRPPKEKAKPAAGSDLEPRRRGASTTEVGASEINDFKRSIGRNVMSATSELTGSKRRSLDFGGEPQPHAWSLDFVHHRFASVHPP